MPGKDGVTRMLAVLGCPGPPPVFGERRRPAIDDFRVMVHIFMAVLIMGTLWRLMSYHFIASKQPHLNHLGQAMATQY
jgi:hypothetical protein